MRFSEDRIIVLEIKTIDNPGFDQTQISSLVLREAENGFCLDSSWVNSLSSAITDAIVHLGSNYRHPLYFDVQVLPREDIDTTIDSTPHKRRRRRKRRKPID